MTTYKGSQNTGARHASAVAGNAWTDHNKVTITAALTTSDDVVLMDVPAGTMLTELKYRAGDLDTGTTLAVNLGYRSSHPDKTMADSPTYFLSASAAFQAAQNGWVDLAFEPVFFKEAGQIVLKPSAGAAGLSGTPSIYAIATGKVLGA